MSKTDNLSDFLTDIADALRAKKGTTEKIDAQNFSSEIESLSSTNGESTSGKYKIKIVDYNGTILDSADSNENDTYTLPTTLPSHDGLTFQEWSSPVEITNNQIVISDSDVIIGAVYTTTSGLSEFDIVLTKITGLSVTLLMGGVKDWGDGTSDTETSHTYSEYGEYTITCDGSITINSLCGVFGQGASRPNYFCVSARLANITSIPTDCFRYCYSLTTITMPFGVTSIGDTGFSSCHSLLNLVIPSSVTNIGVDAFYRCYSLVNLSIPSGITSIDSGAFSGCYSLTNITIPSSVTSIGSSALANCALLSSVTIPDGITSIGASMFYNCYSLARLSIPESIISIGNEAFSGCHSLTNIIIPSGVTSMGTGVFAGNRTLKNISMPNNMSSIESRTFNSCLSLTALTIPDGTTSIGELALYQCVSLSSITIPSSVINIAANAFKYCYSIMRYDFSQATTVPTLSATTAFDGINNIAKIIVPDALYDEWIAATNWSTYTDYIYKASEITD